MNSIFSLILPLFCFTVPAPYAWPVLFGNSNRWLIPLERSPARTVHIPAVVSCVCVKLLWQILDHHVASLDRSGLSQLHQLFLSVELDTPVTRVILCRGRATAKGFRKG